MAKKIKFPLDMGNEVYVRTLEELKENYNSEKVTEYFLDGRLFTWLNDRYYEEEAAAVGELAESGDKENLEAKLGKIFGIEIQDDIDVENLEVRREKLEKLRQITADDEILDNADSVAFSQEELGDLLDEEKEVIYLCGDKFRIPLGVKNVKYIGVNNPTVTISGKGEIDLEASGIVVEKCEFSDDTKARFSVKEENEEIISAADEVMLADLIGDDEETVEEAEFESIGEDEMEEAEFEEVDSSSKSSAKTVYNDPCQTIVDELNNFTKYDQIITDNFNKNPLTSEEVAENFIEYFADCVFDIMNPNITVYKGYPEEYQNRDVIILRSSFANYSLKAKNTKALHELPLKSLIKQQHVASAIIQAHHGILPCNDDTKTAVLSGSLFTADRRFNIEGLCNTKRGSSRRLEIIIDAGDWEDFISQYMIQPVAVVGCPESLSDSMLHRLTSGSIVSGSINVYYQLDMEKLIADILMANNVEISKAWERAFEARHRYLLSDLCAFYMPGSYTPYEKEITTKEEIRFPTILANNEQEFENLCRSLYMPFAATLAANSK